MHPGIIGRGESKMRRSMGALTVILCALVPPLWGAANAPIAAVTDLQGTVTLQRAGERAAKAVGDTTFLRAGDRLQLGKDGRATLFQLYAEPLVLGADRSVT